MSASCSAMRSPMLLASATAVAILSLHTLLPTLQSLDPCQCTWGSPCITMQVTSLRELHQQAQKYNSQLQEYNTKLQQDVALSNDSLQKLQVHLTLPLCCMLPRTQPCCQHSKTESIAWILVESKWHLQHMAASLQALLGPTHHVDVHAKLMLLRQATCYCSRMPALD